MTYDDLIVKYHLQEDEPTGEDTPVEPEEDEVEDEGNESDTDEEVV